MGYIIRVIHHAGFRYDTFRTPPAAQMLLFSECPKILFVLGLQKHLFVFVRVIQFVCGPIINVVRSHKLSA